MSDGGAPTLLRAKRMAPDEGWERLLPDLTQCIERKRSGHGESLRQRLEAIRPTLYSMLGTAARVSPAEQKCYNNVALPAERSATGALAGPEFASLEKRLPPPQH